jgi:hypothetical protein
VDGVALVAGDSSRTEAVQWTVLDSFEAVATFDLVGLAPGSYTLEATRGAATALTRPFTVLAGGTGALSVDLVPPARMRFGVPNAVTVNYGNTGTIDLPLPMITVEAREGGRMGVIAGRADADGGTTFIPPSPVAGTGVLPPGSSGSVTLWYTPPSVGTGDVTFDLWQTDMADPSFADDPMDWATIGAESRPDGVEDAVWAAHVAEERSRYGETYGDLGRYVGEQYAELASIGMGPAIFADGEWLFFPRSANRPTALRTGGTGQLNLPASNAAPFTSAAAPVPGDAPGPGDGVQNVHAVVIGDPDGSLPGARRDAAEFTTLFTKTYNIPEQNVKTLIGKQATPAATMATIAAAKQGLDADDLLVVTVGAHGVMERNDFLSPTLSKNLFAGGDMTGRDWNTALAGSTAPVLLVLDTCQSAHITLHVQAPNVTTLASSDLGQTVPDRSYSKVLLKELEKDPRGDFYAAAQRAADEQVQLGYGGEHLTESALALIGEWRHASIDRPDSWGTLPLGEAQKRVKDAGLDLQMNDDSVYGVGKNRRPLYPTLDRRSNTQMRITPPDPKKAATTGGTQKQKEEPPAKTKKTKVDGDDPEEKPSEKPGKEGEPEESAKVRGEPDDSEESSISTAQSGDPNEIVGPAGVGTPRWVAVEQTLDYEVRFENLGPGTPTIPPGQSIATAPATLVDVTTTLDGDVDMSSFALGDFGVGTGNIASGYPTVAFTPAAGAQSWSEDVPITVPVYGTADPPVSLVLRGTAGLDLATRVVRWTITALDPLTGAPPVDALVGFLPPEDGTHAGQGFARYNVAPVAGVVDARATIVFDTNTPIATDVWSNAIDGDAPTASAAALPVTSAPQFTVTWNGTDSGSGPATFDVFASIDGGPLGLWLDNTTTTAGQYTGQVGHTYGFAVQAVDAVGHEGLVPAQAQALTTVVAPLVTTGRSGYWLVGAAGAIYAYGSSSYLGSTGGIPLNKPIVGMAATPSGNGYRLVSSDGGVFAFGDASYLGSTGAITLNKPIVAVAVTPSSNGYWLVAADGGVFAFGDARYFGSTSTVRLNAPIVGMAATPSGNGYRLVSSDGGVFAFGDASYLGSTGGIRLNQSVVGMAASASGRGYRLVAADGGIFAFGDASYRGSTAGAPLNRPIVGITATASGNGYRLVASDGGVFAFGDAGFLGAIAPTPLNKPVVGMASVG